MTKLVRIAGLEPARPYGHKTLDLAGLPVPPYPRNGVPYRSRTDDLILTKNVLYQLS